MSVNILGHQFDDNDEQVAEALETIIDHTYTDEIILNDYLACCEKFGFVPSTIEELASYVLDPAYCSYYQTNFDYPLGYPADDTAYEDIGHFLLDGTDLWNYLYKDHLNDYFDFEQYGRDYIQNNGCKLGNYGYLDDTPSLHIIISKDEIIELANYLSGRAYEPPEIARILHSINADILDRSHVAKLNPTDYWIIEFNETAPCVSSYKGRIITPALINSIRGLDSWVHNQDDGYYKFYFDHIENGKRTEHIRIDIGDNDDKNHQFFFYLGRDITKISQDQNFPLELPPHILDNVVCAYKPPEERRNTTLADDLQAAQAAANKRDTINPQASLKYTRKH